MGSGEFWEKSGKGRKGWRRSRGDSISGPLDVCGLGAVRLDLMEQEGREKGEGEVFQFLSHLMSEALEP